MHERCVIVYIPSNLSSHHEVAFPPFSISGGIAGISTSIHLGTSSIGTRMHAPATGTEILSHPTLPLRYHSEILSSYYHTTAPSYHHTIIPPYHHTTILSFHRTIMPPYHHTTIPPCRHAAVPPCYHASSRLSKWRAVYWKFTKSVCSKSISTSGNLCPEFL